MLKKFITVLFYFPIILSMLVSEQFQTNQAGELHNVRNISLTTDIELMMVSEELFNKSSNKLFSYVHINYQGHTNYNYTDKAHERLLNTSFDNYLPPTTKACMKLFDNYELDANRPEVVTKEEEMENNEFIDNLIETEVVLDVMHFLSAKGFFQNDLQVYKNILKDTWFHLYSRSRGINGSSGFEHVFLGERKPGKSITGLHNWILFSLAELSNKINYLGFSRNKEFIGKAVILETFFTYIGKRKMSTMFIGTSPELEIALYTLCFFTRPNKRCRVSCAAFKFEIHTYTVRNSSTKYVATAFPIIGKIESK